MIHIAFAQHDYLGNYSVYTGTAIVSIFENTHDEVTIHLLHDNTLTDVNRKNFMDLCSSYGHMINFYNINTDEDFDIAAIEQCGYCEGCMFRLYLPQALPADIDKIIYLDSDVIVNLDISELWNMSLSGCSIAAIVDSFLPFEKKAAAYISDVLNVETSEYFNSGVIVMDIDRIRKTRNLLDDCIDFFKKNTTVLLDQDILNVLFKDDVKYLDEKYNSFLVRNNNRPISSRIYHYNGNISAYYNQLIKMDDLYIHYWDKTPWRIESPSGTYKLNLFSRMRGTLASLQRKIDKGIILTSKEAWQYVQVLHQAGEYEKCLSYLENHIDDEQDKKTMAMKLYWKSACYESMEQVQEQKNALLLSLQYVIPESLTCFKLGSIFLRDKQYIQARFWLETALKTNPPDNEGDATSSKFRTYQKLCKCCIKSGLIKEAKSFNELAGSINPDNFSVEMNRKYFRNLDTE